MPVLRFLLLLCSATLFEAAAFFFVLLVCVCDVKKPKEKGGDSPREHQRKGNLFAVSLTEATSRIQKRVLRLRRNPAPRGWNRGRPATDELRRRPRGGEEGMGRREGGGYFAVTRPREERPPPPPPPSQYGGGGAVELLAFCCCCRLLRPRTSVYWRMLIRTRGQRKMRFPPPPSPPSQCALKKLPADGKKGAFFSLFLPPSP